jgi:hypothetical protein
MHTNKQEQNEASNFKSAAAACLLLLLLLLLHSRMVAQR